MTIVVVLLGSENPDKTEIGKSLWGRHYRGPSQALWHRSKRYSSTDAAAMDSLLPELALRDSEVGLALIGTNWR